MTNAICPNCGNELTKYEGYEIVIGISEHQEYAVGYCENCRKEYRWVNIFSLSHVENIEEVS